MKNYLLLLMSLNLLLFSCKKDDVKDIIDEIDDPINIPIFQLSSTVGNYWVYEWYEIDQNGTAGLLPILDSVYVAGTSSINGNNYVHYAGTYMGVAQDLYLRDSSGYIVNSLGDVVFTRDNVTDTLATVDDIPNNTRVHWMTKKSSVDLLTTMGTFKVYNHQGHYYTLNATPFTPCDSAWIRNSYYDQFDGFEVISQIATASLQTDCKYRERRLVRAYY